MQVQVQVQVQEQEQEQADTEGGPAKAASSRHAVQDQFDGLSDHSSHQAQELQRQHEEAKRWASLSRLERKRMREKRRRTRSAGPILSEAPYQPIRRYFQDTKVRTEKDVHKLNDYF